MSIQEEVALLQNLPLFKNIETAQLKLLAFTSERLAFKAGEDLCVQGEEGDSAFLIINGDADVYLVTEKDEILVATLHQNDIVGEIAILCDVPRTATVRAKTDVETLCISKELFLSMLQQFPAMAIQMMRELAQRLELTNSQLRAASIQDCTH